MSSSYIHVFFWVFTRTLYEIDSVDDNILMFSWKKSEVQRFRFIPAIGGTLASNEPWKAFFSLPSQPPGPHPGRPPHSPPALSFSHPEAKPICLVGPGAKQLESWQPPSPGWSSASAPPLLPILKSGVAGGLGTLKILWKMWLLEHQCYISAIFASKKQTLMREQKLWIWKAELQDPLAEPHLKSHRFSNTAISSDISGCPAFGERCFQLCVGSLMRDPLWGPNWGCVRQLVPFPTALSFQWRKWGHAPRSESLGEVSAGAEWGKSRDDHRQQNK